MNKFNKSNVVVLFFLAFLLVFTPLLPSSVRPTYLYFIFNVLVVALGAKAGLLSAFSKPLEDKKQTFYVTRKPVMPPEVCETEEKEASIITCRSSSLDQQHSEKKPKVVEKYASDSDHEMIVGVNIEVDKAMKKCPSMPNLLVIGGEEAEVEIMDEELKLAEHEVRGVNGQELFSKAEAFIGNFYKQLKMQREETWVYQEAF
ncbi:hypothetical protein RJT34_11998 [Clitoria ternatea]|uniref:DUF4408 domain-containing protein n=1 Tax=Clitoria ternatea TaxID=43366 RepID=A0AAN9JL25_CLITE